MKMFFAGLVIAHVLAASSCQLKDWASSIVLAFAAAFMFVLALKTRQRCDWLPRAFPAAMFLFVAGTGQLVAYLAEAWILRARAASVPSQLGIAMVQQIDIRYYEQSSTLFIIAAVILVAAEAAGRGLLLWSRLLLSLKGRGRPSAISDQ